MPSAGDRVFVLATRRGLRTFTRRKRREDESANGATRSLYIRVGICVATVGNAKADFQPVVNYTGAVFNVKNSALRRPIYSSIAVKLPRYEYAGIEFLKNFSRDQMIIKRLGLRDDEEKRDRKYGREFLNTSQ